MNELSVVETRAILKELKANRNFDLSEFALTSLKYRLAKILTERKIKPVEVLIDKCISDDAYFDNFIHELMVPSTEMFRDPSLWRWLKEVHFPSVKQRVNNKPFSIWFPFSVDGLDLASLVILLKELDMVNHVKIFVNTLSNKSIECIKNGVIPIKKYELSSDNYNRFQGMASLDEYVTKDQTKAIINAELFKNIEITKVDTIAESGPQNVKMIFFRNFCIYVNTKLQERILEKLYDRLSPSGNLILGVKERMRNMSVNSKFVSVNDLESVYKKV